MTRSLYRSLLCLHPPAFRQRFAAEMLWIFDEASPEQGAVLFFADGLCSVIRQWLAHPGMWTIAVGAIGGLVELAFAGSLIMGPPQRTSHLAPAALDDAGSSLEKFSGTWKEVSTGPSGSIELTLAKKGTAWIGEVRFKGLDGEMHAGRAEDLRVEGDLVRFRMAAGGAGVTFTGKLRQGRLAGTLAPAADGDEASGNPQEPNPAETRNHAGRFGFQAIVGWVRSHIRRPAAG